MIAAQRTQRSQQAMERFEKLMAANRDRPLFLPQVVRKIGVGERTFRALCLQHVKMSPHRYLWLRRMHLTRRALALADPATTNVTTIANDYGFGELGRFAVAYKGLFGESPSATLRSNAPQVEGI